MTTNLIDPQTLAQETIDEIESSILRERIEQTDILDALQEHYMTIETNQQLYINYLTEFIEKLKTTQHADKESLAQLKKEVLKQVLRSEK